MAAGRERPAASEDERWYGTGSDAGRKEQLAKDAKEAALRAKEAKEAEDARRAAEEEQERNLKAFVDNYLRSPTPPST